MGNGNLVTQNISKNDQEKLKSIYDAFCDYCNFKISYQDMQTIIENNSSFEYPHLKNILEVKDGPQKFYAKNYLGINNKQFLQFKKQSPLFEKGYRLFEQFANGEVVKADLDSYQKYTNIPVETAAVQYAAACGLTDEYKTLKKIRDYYKVERGIMESKYYRWLHDAEDDKYFKLYFLDFVKRIIYEGIDLNVLMDDCPIYVKNVYTSVNSLNEKAINGTDPKTDIIINSLKKKVSEAAFYYHEIDGMNERLELAKDQFLEAEFTIQGYIDSGKSFDEYIQDSKMKTHFLELLRCIKDADSALFENFKNVVAERGDEKDLRIGLGAITIYDYITNGVPETDGIEAHNFTLFDYYDTLSPFGETGYFLMISKAVLLDDEYICVRNTIKRLWDECKNNIISDTVLRGRTIKYNDCVISSPDKSKILSYMYSKNIPITEEFFKMACCKYFSQIAKSRIAK